MFVTSTIDQNLVEANCFFCFAKPIIYQVIYTRILFVLKLKPCSFAAINCLCIQLANVWERGLMECESFALWAGLLSKQ